MVATPFEWLQHHLNGCNTIEWLQHHFTKKTPTLGCRGVNTTWCWDNTTWCWENTTCGVGTTP